MPPVESILRTPDGLALVAEHHHLRPDRRADSVDRFGDDLDNLDLFLQRIEEIQPRGPRVGNDV